MTDILYDDGLGTAATLAASVQPSDMRLSPTVFLARLANEHDGGQLDLEVGALLGHPSAWPAN